mgnify:CR=1 FL=1
MADNVAVTAGSGTTIATDDVAGVHYQRVKLVDGTLEGTGAIGGDAANGLDVDVTRIVPGTTATALGKAEDAAHTTGDTGVMALAVRNDTNAALAGIDGDYIPLSTDSIGGLRVGGNIAHDAVDSGNPVKIGGIGNNSVPTAVAAGDRVGAWFSLSGATIVNAVLGQASADALDANNNLVLDPAGNVRPLTTAKVQYNGAGFDRERGNIDATILASAARTATTVSADQTNYSGRGLHLVFDITAVPGADTVTLTIQGKDALSGKYYTILAGAAQVATGTIVMRVYPGLVAAANLVANDVLPRTWRASIAHSAASSFTYSGGASVIL